MPTGIAIAWQMWEAGLWLEDKGSWKRGSVKEANANLANAKLGTAAVEFAQRGTILTHDIDLALFGGLDPITDPNRAQWSATVRFGGV